MGLCVPTPPWLGLLLALWAPGAHTGHPIHLETVLRLKRQKVRGYASCLSPPTPMSPALIPSPPPQKVFRVFRVSEHHGGGEFYSAQVGPTQHV